MFESIGFYFERGYPPPHMRRQLTHAAPVHLVARWILFSNLALIVVTKVYHTDVEYLNIRYMNRQNRKTKWERLKGLFSNLNSTFRYTESITQNRLFKIITIVLIILILRACFSPSFPRSCRYAPPPTDSWPVLIYLPLLRLITSH